MAKSLDLERAARLLGVSPGTLRRWARQGVLGVRAPGGELRFSREELERWAQERGIRLITGPGVASPPVVDVVPVGGILRDVEGDRPQEVLARLVESAPLPESVDRERLLRRLLDREALSSTGLGNGIALPHPRKPDPALAPEPMAIFALFAHPMDWKAIDGEPVHSAILLLSPTPAQHLRLLGRVAFFLRDAEFCRMLAERAPDAALLERMSTLEPTRA